jgi:Virus neck protein
MPTTSFFFNNQNFTSEQRLLDNLTVEMIKIYGVDVIYCPRTTPNIDKLFLEDPTSEFNNAIHIEMYIKNYEGWQGEGDMMSKFGITMADQITFCVSRTRFQEDIGSQYSIIRPREGDLIFFPIPNAIFEVKFVEHEAAFYQTGSLQFFELKCERFNYSDETLDTGIQEIDVIEPKYSFATDGYRLTTEGGAFIVTETGNRLLSEDLPTPDKIDGTVQNQYFEDRGMDIDFTAANPFNE